MRQRFALALCSLVMTASLAAANPADPARDGGPRIRLMDGRLADLLATGQKRSATLRALVNRVEAGNVIVYIALNPLMKSSLAGSLTWMTRAGEFRYVRASINTELTQDLMVATLAHELQHVIEVGDDPRVIDQRSLTELYKRIGHPSRSAIPSTWETVAAQETGLQVRRELVAAALAAAAARTAETGQL